MSGLRRVALPTASSAGLPQVPPTGAEPVRKSTLFIQHIDPGLKLSNLFTFELPESQVAKLAEAIAELVETMPETKQTVGRPPTRLIVVEVNKQDPNYRGGEYALDLGEVISVPSLVRWFSGPEDRTSAQLVRHYLKDHRPFKKYGYTLRLLEDFDKDLKGPAGQDFHAVAEAHIAWAKENNVTPFE